MKKKVVVFIFIFVLLFGLLVFLSPKLLGNCYKSNVCHFISSSQNWLVAKFQIGVSCKEDGEYGRYLSFSSINKYNNIRTYNIQNKDKYLTKTYAKTIGCSSYKDIYGDQKWADYNGNDSLINGSGFVEISDIVYRYTVQDGEVKGFISEVDGSLLNIQ